MTTSTTSDGVKIHYITQGKGTPVVLIHGYTGSAQGNWFSNGVAEALAKNHWVVALDCRNHGKSDKPQLNGPGKAEDVVELMDHLKIQKAHLHGYSMGGGIVGRLLVLIPNRIITAARRLRRSRSRPGMASQGARRQRGPRSAGR